VANPEQLLLSKVLRTGELQEAVLRVNSDFFHEGKYFDVWEFVVEFWEQFSKCPSAGTVKSEFGDLWQIEKTPEPVDYYVQLLVEAHKRYATVELAAEAAEFLRNDQVDEALSAMSAGVLDITTAVVETEDIDAIATGEEQILMWEEMAKDPGALKGIPTGFQFIDDVTGGMQPEQFIVLIGAQKAGKSSVAMKVAVSASDLGFSVLYMSYEMSNLEQQARYGAMRGGFNPNKLLQGRASAKEMEALRQGIKRAKNGGPLYFIHDMGARTLSSMIAKVHQYKPDLVIVDGIYLMDAEIEGVESIDTRSLTKLSRALKVLAQTVKVPVFGTTQALESKMSAKHGLRATSAGYTSAFGQDCDVMLGVEAPEDDAEEEHKIKIIIGRNVARSSALLLFDWDHGRIEEMAAWDGEDEEEAEEDDRRAAG
jgi:replicative DNA helicase